MNNTMDKANKIKIAIGVALPVLAILIVFAIAFVPRFFFTPKYDFVYALSSDTNSSYGYYYENNGRMYNVVDGKIEEQAPVIRPEYRPDYKGYKDAYTKLPENIVAPKQNLYRYKAKTDTFEQITLDQARKLTLTGNSSAPDGTVLDSPGYYGRGLVGEIIGGSRNDGRNFHIRNGSWVRDITLTNAGSDNYYYYGDGRFYFLGWVLGE